MNRGIKLLIIIAVVITVLGGALLTIAFAKGAFSDNGGEGVINYHENLGAFNSISIDTDTSNIEFVLAEDGKCKVECHEKEKVYHEVKVDNNTLSIVQIDTREKFKRFSMFDFYERKVIIYLPAGEYDKLDIKLSTGDTSIIAGYTFNSITINCSTGDTKIASNVNGKIYVKSSTGDIELDHINAKELDLAASTGNVKLTNVTVEEDITISTKTGKKHLTDVTCDDITLSASTGKTYLTRMVARGKLTINVSTGDIILDKSDAKTIDITTSTGDVTGTLLTAKSFYVQTDTGKLEVPPTSGEECNITTDTGDVKISIEANN